ncbi:MAG: DUF6492 family protein [Leptolyngbyaceae cyanobacterium]
MSALSFAMVTPTYANDYEQFALLAHTVERRVPEHVPHYVIVPSEDYDLFQPLRSSRTRLLKDTEVLPRWAQGLFKVGRYRVTTRSLPLRGWILQQLIKLSAPLFADEDVYLNLDSDTAFLRDFDPAIEFVRDGKVRLFCELSEPSWPDAVLEQNRRWRDNSLKLLGITGEKAPRAGYVGQIVPWRRNVLESIHQHLDRGWGRSWQERLGRCLTLSEYTLYGVYVENVLGFEAAGHCPDDTKWALESWAATEQSLDDLQALRDEQLKQHHIALMVSAKGHTPAERINQVFELRSPETAGHS